MKRKILKIFLAVFMLHFLAFWLFLAADYAYPLDLNSLKRENSPLLYDDNGRLIAMKPSIDGIWRMQNDKITKQLKQTTLLFEDRYFYYHFGVNPFSIIRSIFHNLTHTNRIGASTITMQVARMMNRNERTYTNKMKEIFRAFQLEWHFSKDEILNFYFSLAPYGGNIESITAAAKFYFDKNLDELSIAQMALLSTIPKNPNANRLDKKSNINELKNRLVTELFNEGLIDENQLKRAKKEPFENRRFDAVFTSPHFSNLAFKNGISNSNLNSDLQQILNQNLISSAKNLANKNAKNAAGIIIDNSKMSVVAYVGSHNQKAKDGQNDGVMMRRNVGSTLKPFIYSLGLDNGLITPKSQMIDTEIFLNEYSPKNYNNQFLGIVTASEALGFSLNIPAIWLNLNLGKNSLYELLWKLDLVDKKKEFYGDSIVLGSSEMSLLNLAHLYTVYANNGALKPLEIAGKIQGKTEQLISPQAAFLTAKMMSEAARSYLGNFWQYAKDTPQIAFKTGTSYGSRDIYAIGVNQNYTIAVWFGNFNGEKTENLSGVNDAAKAIFGIFKILAQRQNLQFFVQPDKISKREVCVDAFIKKECEKLQLDDVIDGVVSANRCEFLRSEELAFLLKNGIINHNDIKSSPCYEYLKNKPPLIAKPFNNQILMTNQKKDKIMLKCYAYIGDEIFYKVDNEEFKKIKNASEISLELGVGEHLIGCLDENSNLSQIKIILKEF